MIGREDAPYAAFSFEPGPTARSAGPWTRLRRSFAIPQAAIASPNQFNPDLTVQLAGPLTRLRRSGSELALDLPLIPRLGDRRQGGDLIPVERLAGLALRAAPVGVTLLGVVVVVSLLHRPRSSAGTEEAVVPAGTAIVANRSAGPGVEARGEAETLPLGRVEARLVAGEAVLPENAPQALKSVVAAANAIDERPYIYGGGHGSFASSGYDCSGAVSYALHGGHLLESPLNSGSLTGWGRPGAGKAVTVYANGGHAYAVIAGLRWDTSDTGGSGPSWHSDMRSPAGYVARHPTGY
jgi:hypothetical protein